MFSAIVAAADFELTDSCGTDCCYVPRLLQVRRPMTKLHNTVLATDDDGRRANQSGGHSG
jgi:hypothetical protein